MKHLALACSILMLTACATTPTSKPTSAPRSTPRPGEPPVEMDYPAPSVREVPLQDRLGMRRAADDLGFVEKQFDGCADGETCRPQYLSVVHFQLLCRDSEGTVSNVPLTLTPLTSDQVRWQIGDHNGDTSTDAQGFGQFTVISDQPTQGQRLILRIGKQFMGFTVSEVSKVVLPQNFCI